MKFSGSFVIRVYAIILNEKNEVLITDEFRMNQSMTKFPGGGLKFGEGTIDCLKREIKEECNGQELKNIRHFYTTDFYQKSYFHKNKQIVSIYYSANLDGPAQFLISEYKFDYINKGNKKQSFRWVDIDKINADLFTFPIDKIVALKIKDSAHEKD